MSDKELLNKLRDSIAKQSLQIPDKGFFTVKQWRQKWGISKSAAERLIFHGLKTGEMVAKSFKVKSGNVIRNLKHFKAK